MRLKGIFVSTFALAAVFAASQTWEKPIAPGVIYRMDVDRATPRIIHAIRFSLGAPGMSLKSELGGGTVIEENASKGRETMSEMVARTGAIAAVNGDFFPFTGDPLGAMVRDGQLLSVPGIQRAVFGWGASSAYIGLVDFQGTASIAGQEIPIKGLNEDCPLNEIVLNTEAAAFATAKSPNVHAVLRMESSNWTPNGTFTGTYESILSDSVKVPIMPGQAVLTASGTKAELLKSLSPGEKVTLNFKTRGFDWNKVDQTMGGGPFLVRDNQIAVDAERQGFNEAFSKKRHPRTAMGRTKDGDVWIVVIDGRQKISDGATLEETAKIMLDLGCVDAVDLDGGGSSAINILGLTVNRPSDGKERPVANGVILMGPKPEPMATPLAIRGPEKLAIGYTKTFTVAAENGQMIPHAEIFWASSGDAWIDQGGLLRPIQIGKVEISAYVRGQLLRFSMEIVEPEKKEPKPKKLASRSKRGRG